jgi:hypothetical protein
VLSVPSFQPPTPKKLPGVFQHDLAVGKRPTQRDGFHMLFMLVIDGTIDNKVPVFNPSGVQLH